MMSPKKIVVIPLFLLLISTYSLYSRGVKQDVRVIYKKKGFRIYYSIIFKNNYHFNEEAPFIFNLKERNGKLLKNVEIGEFTKKGGNLFYTSTFKEKKLDYFFVGCKEYNGKAVSCKTFKKVIKIK